MKQRHEIAEGLATVDVDSIASIDEYNRTQKLLAQTRTLLEGVHSEPTLRQPPTRCGRVIMRLAHTSTRIVTSTPFRYFIFVLIGLGGVLVGLKMYLPSVTELTAWVGALMTVAFTLEMVLKVLTRGDKPWEYLYRRKQVQSWNVLDAAVVLANYVPGVEQDLLMVFRMLLVSGLQV
jgi:hypothetical protein